MKKMIITAVIAVTLGAINSAYAYTEEGDAAIIKKLYNAARNSAGLASYCADQGFLGADSVEAMQKEVAHWATLPQVKDISDGDKMEAIGRAGKLYSEVGEPIRLQDVPEGIEAWCDNIGKLIRTAVASRETQ